MPATTETRVPKEDLDALLASRIEAARVNLLKGNGRLDTVEIEEIERVARFIALHKEMTPPKRERHVLAIGLLVGTLIAVSLLMYARLPTTDVEVFATTSEVGFRSQAPQTLSEGMEADDVLIACACDIRLPSSPGQPSRVLASSGAESIVRLTVAGEGDRRGSITIAPVTLTPDSLVRLRHRGAAGAYGLSIEAPQLALRVNLYGTIVVAIPGELESSVDFVVPKALIATTGGKELTLDIQTNDKDGLGLASQLLVNSLSFVRTDEPAAPGLPVRNVSTLAGGTLYWEALDGRERTLRPSERIEFDRVRGEIVAVDFKPTDIALRFHGEVGAVTAGWGENRRSLMPTWLEWLRARHSLSLLWGSTVYVVGLLLGALRWFKVSL